MLFLNEKKKKVTFSKHVHVILIPSRIEYINYGMYKHLWYSEMEYQQFIMERIPLKSKFVSLNAV